MHRVSTGQKLFKLAPFASLYLVACCAGVLAQENAPLTDCDKYAASDVDKNRNATGIAIEKVDPKLAIPACLEALQRYPNSVRFIYQLARGYLQEKEYKTALEFNQKASDDGLSRCVECYRLHVLEGIWSIAG